MKKCQPTKPIALGSKWWGWVLCWLEIEKCGGLVGIRWKLPQSNKQYKALLVRIKRKPDCATLFTYLKAYNGAPVWSTEEVRKFQMAFE